MRSLDDLRTSSQGSRGLHWIKQPSKIRTYPNRNQIQSQEETAMATEIGSRGSTYPSLVMRSATASRSEEDVLLGGANLPGGGGPAVKWHGRRRRGARRQVA